MSPFVGLFTALLMVHAAHSYILLTANLEDVQTLAKQLVSSPVVDQINRIWRRASNQFNRHMSNDKQRRAGRDMDGEEESQRGSVSRRNYKQDQQGDAAHRRNESPDDDLVALGKNASLYLRSIKRIFEKI